MLQKTFQSIFHTSILSLLCYNHLWDGKRGFWPFSLIMRSCREGGLLIFFLKVSFGICQIWLHHLAPGIQFVDQTSPWTLQLECLHQAQGLFCAQGYCTVLGLVTQSWVFETPWTVACQAPLSLEFSREEYWSGLPSPTPGDPPNPGMEPRSPTLQVDSLLSELPGKPLKDTIDSQMLDNVTEGRSEETFSYKDKPLL